MKKYLVTGVLLLVVQLLCAQDLTRGCQYIFPEFSRGVIYYKEGAAVRYPMNYNLLTDEMQYINDKDKVTALYDFEKIEYISIGTRRFIPLEADFAEIIVDDDYVSLALKRNTKVSGTSRSKLNKSLSRNEDMPDNIITSTDSTYYLIRVAKPEGIKKGVLKGLSFSQDRVVSASHSGFMKVFSKHKDEIKEYIENENIDIKNPEDLIRLTHYCNNLIL